MLVSRLYCTSNALKATNRKVRTDSMVKSRVLKFVNFFVEAAKNDPKFLTIIIEANILGFLRPYLALELQNTASSIAHHRRKKTMVYDKQDLFVLALISEHGLQELLASNGDILAPIPVRRGFLTRTLDIILQEVVLIQIVGKSGISKHRCRFASLEEQTYVNCMPVG